MPVLDLCCEISTYITLGHICLFSSVLLKCDCFTFQYLSLCFLYLAFKVVIFSFLRAFYIVYIHTELAIICIVVLMLLLLLVRFQNSAVSQHTYSWWWIKQPWIFYSAYCLGFLWKVTKTWYDSKPVGFCVSGRLPTQFGLRVAILSAIWFECSLVCKCLIVTLLWWVQSF